MRPRAALPALMLTLAACSSAVVTPAAPAASGAAPIASALAYVQTDGFDGFDSPVATAICVASNDRISYFLTSAHAVEPGATSRLEIVRDGRPLEYPLTIVRRSRAPLDLAVVSIPLGGFAAATFSTVPIARAERLTEINYRDLVSLRGREPLQRQTVIADTVFAGSVLRATGLDDRALTGGPLTDPASGAVLAVATFYVPTTEVARFTVATTVRAILPFLRAAGVAPRLAGPAPPEPPDLGGYAAVTTCLDAERGLDDAATIDRCAGAYFSLVPSTLLLRDADARPQALTTVYDLFRCTHAIALAQSRVGERTYGIVNAVQTIGWGRRLLRLAPPAREPTLRAEVTAMLLEIATAYPSAAASRPRKVFRRAPAARPQPSRRSSTVITQRTARAYCSSSFVTRSSHANDGS